MNVSLYFDTNALLWLVYCLFITNVVTLLISHLTYLYNGSLLIKYC